MTFQDLQDLYKVINSMKAEGITERHIVRFLMDMDFEPETGFWLIDKAAEAK